MALSGNINVDYADTQLRMQRSFQPADAGQIWEGGCYELNTSTNKLAVPSGTYKIVGFAMNEARGKTLTGNLTSDQCLIAWNMSAAIIVAGTPIIDAPVYASSDNVFTTVQPGGTSISIVGTISEILNATTGLCRVRATTNA